MPLESGFLNTPVNLKDIDFSKQDADDIVQETIAWVQTNYPDLITDFNKSQVAMMLLQATAKTAERLAYSTEMKVKNILLPTTRHRPSAAKILKTIGYEMGRALAASAKASITINEALTEDIILDPATQVQIDGPDSQPLYFEIYNITNGIVDFESSIVLPQGDLVNTELVCIEGQTITDSFTHNSNDEFPAYILDETGVLDDYFKVTVNGIIWERVNTLIYEALAGKYYEVNHLSNGTTRIKFGNGLSGAKPQLGSDIEITYRIGGGERGLVTSGYFNVSKSVFVAGSEQRTVTVAISNTEATSGGSDEESLEHAKLYGPKYYAALGKGGTGEDYTTLANLHTSSLGSVLKAIAVHRGYASALGSVEGPFVVDQTSNRLEIETNLGVHTVIIPDGSHTTQEVADIITQAGSDKDFTGDVYNNKIIIASINDNDTNTKLNLREVGNSAYTVLGLGIGFYAQYGSRHVDIYAFGRGPLDSNSIPTAVPLTSQQKLELEARLSESNTKMLTDEVEVKDAGYKLVDITATIQVNNGVNIQTVETQVLNNLYKFFNPELWDFGKRLNTIEIEKTIYNAAEGIEDIVLVEPQTAVIPTSYQLISKGNLNLTFEYIS